MSGQMQTMFIALCIQVYETAIADPHKAYYHGLIVDGTTIVTWNIFAVHHAEGPRIGCCREISH